MRKLATLFLFATALAPLGCDDGGPRLVPTTVQIAPAALTLNDGDSARVAATVLDQKGKPLLKLAGAAALTWSSSAPAVASVTDGLVRANRPGTAQLTAQAGSAQARVEVTVQPVPREIRPAGGDGQRGAAGVALADSLAVRVLDRHGNGVAGVAVSFVVVSGEGSLSTPIPTTGADGTARTAWVLGGRTGPQSARAQAGGLSGTALFQATAIAGAPSELRRLAGDGQGGPAGTRLPNPLVVQAVDRFGNPAAGAEVAWAVTGGGGSISPARAVADSAGRAEAVWTLGAGGAQSASATVNGVAPATFTASLGTVLTRPELVGISPATLTPGATATLTGSNFGATADAVTVTVAGTRATVLTATPTQLTVRVPDRSALPCEPTRAVPVEVRVGEATGSRSHPLAVAIPRTLAVGQALPIGSAADLRCNELPRDGGRYLISVYNVSQSLGSIAALEARTSTGSAASVSAGRAPIRVGAQPRARRGAAPSALDITAGPAHLHLLEANRRLAERFHSRLRRAAGPSLSRARAPLPRVGDTLSFNVPNIATSDYCANFTPIRARAVYVGTRGVVFEDVAAPLAGQMDSTYQAIGAEFDRDMYPVITANFGDPLKIDGHTDANGRFFMLFTKVVQDNSPSVAGFVTIGDFLARADCAGSNVAEIFYARVPTSTQAGYGSGTRGGWLRSMRSTIIHEVKHITSYAERIDNYLRTNQFFAEESWLEESTARMSEEIWARRIFGYAQKGNVTYRQSIYCEVRPSNPACAGSPLVMLDHFDGMYSYLEAGGGLTPLGRSGSDDWSFYGSGWSLVRWAIDQGTATESAFLRALTQDPRLAGIRNLEARAGRTFDLLLADWSVALAIDDRPGLTPESARHTFPSWNTRDVFEGLNGDFPTYWAAASPLQVRTLPADGTATSVAQLRGGGATLLEVAASSSQPQVVEVRGRAGAPLATTVRMTLVRVQ